MGKKKNPFLLRTNYYPFYKTFIKTPFKFKKYFLYNSKLNWDIYSYFKNLENIFLILDIKINYWNYNNIIIYIYLPFYNKLLNLQISDNKIYFLVDKVKYLQKLINLKYKLNYNFYFEIIYSKKEFNFQNYIIFYIKNLITNNNSFKTILKKSLFELNFILNNIYILYGLKIKIKGRIKGSNLSKIENFKKGIIPLQTINNNIKYNWKYIKTKFGSLGIKLWIFFINYK
uniref:30S ribosomal protein S3 n=1 Tax=Nephromyces sp. ex Molgula occidentalis TaxID=2544991 RepID=A0A5C1H8H4_9APIC|nr:30S ribosomal protein S3 [Nephromyces sp. ex Molgula occidentalis]